MAGNRKRSYAPSKKNISQYPRHKGDDVNTDDEQGDDQDYATGSENEDEHNSTFTDGLTEQSYETVIDGVSDSDTMREFDNIKSRVKQRTAMISREQHKSSRAHNMSISSSPVSTKTKKSKQNGQSNIQYQAHTRQPVTKHKIQTKLSIANKLDTLSQREGRTPQPVAQKQTTYHIQQ